MLGISSAAYLIVAIAMAALAVTIAKTMRRWRRREFTKAYCKVTVSETAASRPIEIVASAHDKETVVRAAVAQDEPAQDLERAPSKAKTKAATPPITRAASAHTRSPRKPPPYSINTADILD